MSDHNHDHDDSHWLTPEEESRFRSKYERRGDCWIWQGPLDKDGYGAFYLRRRNRRAHRVAWYWRHGAIPEGMVINHRCQCRACVNPQHLELVTAAENVFRNSRSLPALNRAKTECPKGHPYDRFYGRQRSCSICDAAKSKRLRAAWKTQADQTRC